MPRFATILLVLCSLFPRVYAGTSGTVEGVVRDPAGAVVTDATVALLSAQRVTLANVSTTDQGRFTLNNVPPGSYLLVVTSKGFTERRMALTIRGSAPAENVEIVLDPQPVRAEVTVTAIPGMVESVESISQQVNVIDRQEIDERAKTVLAQVVNEETGVHLQRTSPTLSGIFVRGLTGNKVNVFVDGVRFTTSAQRGGINTFLNLIDSSNLQAVEILRGPNSAQYGSDAIGGSIQFLSRVPSFSPGGDNFHGQMSVFFNSADLGYGSNLSTSFATSKFGLIANVAGRRANTLRPGEGIDSHNAVTRFLGISSDLVIGDRLPDTAFTQYGGMLKLNWEVANDTQILTGYMRGQQDGGKRYDQLLGGDGNLVSDLRNLMNDFFYVKLDRLNAGWLNSVTLGYSFNSQREERVNQGGNGNPRASINHEYERLNAHGLQAFATKQVGARQNLLFGAEYYHERLHSPAFGDNPVTNQVTIRRPRVPDNARYESGGIYLQDVFDAIPNTLRLMGNIRYSAAAYRARAEDSPIVGGRRLWPDDSLRVSTVTFRAGAVYTPVRGLSLMANVGRGFRAPHLTDLDTVGLTGSGFEVTASEVAGLGATVGTTANTNAVSSGSFVSQVGPETSLNYEVGARYYRGRIDTDFAFFVNNIRDLITKQALILPQGAVGLTIGGERISSQTPSGAVFVPAATTPVLVRANYDDGRIYGFEHTFDFRVASDWAVKTVFTYLHARDRRTGEAPNVEGGTPAPDGWLKIRYAPSGKRFWVEPYMHIAGRQDRLSSLDLADRRTGASRSRSSIANFFLNGATARGLVSPGPDARFGTADDFLLATGETLSQIQARVLGPTGEPSPLFTAIPGYVTFNVRGGYRFGERHDILVDFENVTDRNYRGISWGLDAPGRGVFLKFNTRF